MGTPAPLDRSALERALAPFGASRNLPQEAYVSQEVFEWELEHFCSAGWVCAGRADGLAKPGDQRAVRVGNDGILLVRDEAGVLRGFYNVCRHRGHELLEPGQCAQARAIRCPYHGWTYELDGRLKVAPRAGDITGFDPAAHSLSPARIAEWHGWVFANAAGDAPPLADWLGDLEDRVRPYEPERLRVAAEKSYDVAANWKLVHENYHECYHCPNIHPELCRVSPHESGKNVARVRGAWIGGRMDLMPNSETMSLDGKSRGIPLRGLNAEQKRHVDYFGLVPNLFLSLHPDYVLTHRLEALAPGRVRIECEWLFPPEALAKPGFSPQYAFEFWDLTNLQDWRALESVERGVSSRGYRPGPLAQKEDAVYQFVSRIARGYLDGRFDPAPQLRDASASSK
jgi:Rieske 2Fe-2S family protein